MKKKQLIYSIILLLFTFSSASLLIAQDRSVKGTTIVGKISKEEIETKCPGVKVTLKGKDRSTNENVYFVEGDHKIIEQTLSKDKNVRVATSHGEFTTKQLNAMKDLSQALLLYAGYEGWRIKGGSWIKGSHTQDGGKDSKYLCYICTNCPEPTPPPMMPPSLIPDCEKPANLDDLYNEYLKWAGLTEVLTQLLNTYNWFDYWTGLANMAKDMISAAALLLPGAGSVLAKGLNMVIQMAAQGALSAVLDYIKDQLGVPDISSKAACQAALSFANNKRKQAWDAYSKIWYAYIDCQNAVNAQNAKTQAEIDAWNQVKNEYLKKWADYKKCMDNPKRCGWVECF